MNQVVDKAVSDLLAVSKNYVAMSEQKRKLFRSQLQAKGIDASRLPIVAFPNRADSFPLSYAQERLWFLWRLDPSSSSYNIAGAAHLKGVLDQAHVRVVLDRIFSRHESLRKRFAETDGVPRQHVGGLSYGWSLHDLQQGANASASSPQDSLQDLLQDLSRQPFDLSAGPLLRVALIRLAADEHVLHFSMHHIISDGWSMGLFNREFAQAYQQVVAGADAAAETAPAPLAIQYGDYAVWQREWLDDAALQAQLDYWRMRLGSEHPVLELPLARKRIGLRSAEGGRVELSLSASLSTALKRLARSHDSSMFMLLLAAYDILLARYSGQGDIRVGVPVAGRDRIETEQLIGFFVNTLVVRSELHGIANFSQLLAHVRERVLEAQAHQDLPFALLVDALQPARSLSHSPLFQVMFNFSAESKASYDLPGLTVSGVQSDMETSRFDLVLTANEAEVLTLGFNFSRDVLDEPVVQDMLQHYATILEQLGNSAAGAELALGNIGLLAQDHEPVARAQHDFAPIAARISARAALQPAAPALHCEGERLNYGELEAWSNRIAHRLQRLGVRADERVGLCVARSVGMSAGLLGIMKSGGAFVPLDPDYPEDRLAYMLEDAGVRRVLADAATAERLAVLLKDCEVVVISALQDEADTPLVAEVHPQQLAYVIYTSGSTGRPKGVAISQDALSRHLDDFIQTYAISASDKQFQSSTINFDVALHEMLPALIQGGQVEMRGPQLWDLATTSRHLAEQGVTFSRIPTAYWQQWLRNPPAASELAALRQITVGGEGLPGDALRQWREGPLRHIRLDNLYGPTETTVACMYRETTASDTEQAIVSIGQAYASRTVYVLDGEGNEVPVGGLGELCIGGDTLARGYLDRADLTAEKFIPDPYRRDGARLYRSGDLCRRREDGTIDFLGRMDQQVKLRGFRIELGEIEAVLRQVAGVREAVVELKGEGEGKRLVAYTVGAATEAQLRQDSAKKLPGYMVPSVFVALERLPVMQNGKVDRKALPDPEQGADTERVLVAPRNDTERQLLAIWREVLGREDIGVSDNFFEVGGDSILSLRIIARAAQAGLRLTPRQIFEYPDIARLALMATAVSTQELPPETHELLDLTPIQEVFFERHPDGESHWNQSVLLQTDAVLDIAALGSALDALVQDHDALRLHFVRPQQAGGRWRQRVAAVGQQPILEVIDLSAQPDWRAQLEQQCQRLQRSLDIQAGPLMRAGYFQLGGQDRLLLTIHHLAVDGVSWRILLDELALNYERIVAGAGQLSGARRYAWSAWCAALQTYATRPQVQDELAYWQSSIGGTAPLALAAVTEPAQHRQVSFDAATTASLLSNGQRAYRMGIDDILLTALTRAVSNWAAQDAVLVALEGHGRDDLGQGIDLSGSIGWFTTRYPVCLRAPTAPDEALVAVKETLRSVPAKGLHWGLLRSYGNAGQRAVIDALPQPQIGFNYLGQFDQSLKSGGHFSFATESGGDAMVDGGRSPYGIDINGMVAGGRLSLDWNFAAGCCSPERSHALVAAFEAEVLALAAHCAQAPLTVTAADFPASRLRHSELQELALPLAEIQDIYPATPLQSGMLYHSLVQDGEGLYVIQKTLGLSGVLDVAMLQQAWQQAIARHDILRTSFIWERSGDALQIVWKNSPLEFQLHDRRAQEIGAYHRELAAWREADRRRGFELARAPMLRINLFQRPDGGHDLVWTSHHILMDGWSSAQLFGEVIQLYRALSTGAAAASASAPAIPYRNYVEWLAAQDNAEAWWRQRLASADEPATLAGGMPFGASAAQVDGEHELLQVIDAPLSGVLAAVARRHQVTMNTLVQAAWALLLGRLGNRNQVVFGITVSGRPPGLAGIETMLGLFINSLPLWVGLPSAARLSDWLQALQADNSVLRQYEHTPLARLQQWSGRSGEALFDSLLVFENYPIDEKLREGETGLSLASYESVERSHYPLVLTVAAGEQLSIRWTWDQALISSIQAQRLARYFAAILSQLADSHVDTDDPLLGDISLADAAAISASRLALQGPAQTYADLPVHRQIEAIVAARPDAVALLYGDAELSYGELNRRANQLAHHLAQLGVGPEVKVGLALERSVEMVVGLLAVLKASGAYVPLDPDYPQERLAYMMDDSGIALLLTQSHVQPRLPATSLPTLALDQLVLNQLPTHNPERALHAENLAYVIYTSGSTGRPKGAGNRHAALSNRLAWMQQAYRLNAGDTVLQKTPFSFDVSVWEFFWPLLAGARLALSAPGAHRDPAELSALIARHAVTTLHFVPAMLQAFVAHAEGGASALATLASLRRVICSGEALPAGLKNQTLALLPAVQVHNLYGPTEAAIDVTHWDCLAADAEVPIGRPIANVTAQVLDTGLNLLPAQVAGELYLGGVGLGRGYENRAALTAERFVPDPHGAPGARMYRTGDLARWRDDGALIYLGRLDHQVKIRGLRIELGEIEAQLSALPGVREATVLALDAATGARLAAYVTAQAGTQLQGEALLQALARTVPDYMVPATITILAQLPLSPNGKIDRKALPYPDLVQRQYQAPQGERETMLAAIWQEVLGVASVGRDDNFFALGGDSILSLQIIARLRRAGWRLTPRQLFAQQTVRLSAPLVQYMSDASVGSGADEVSGLVPLLPVQQAFFALPLAQRQHWNQAVMLTSGQALDTHKLERALQLLLVQHDALRLRFVQDQQGGWTQSYAPSEAAQLLQVVAAADGAGVNADQLLALCEATQRSLDLANGPLLRALAVELADGDWRLLLVIHHLAVDGVSWRILLEDLQTLYGQLCRGEPAILPAKSSSYKAWATQLAQHAQSPALQAQLGYWREVAATPATLRARDGSAVSKPAAASLRLDEARTRSLLQDAPQAYRTQVNDLLLTALGRALCQWSGQSAVRVDMEGHGREDLFDGLDLSRTVGWFTTIYPLRLTSSGQAQALGEAIVDVKEGLRAMPDKGLSFGLLRYQADEASSAELRAMPPSQVLFNYLGQFDNSFQTGDGAGWQPAAESSGAAQDPDAPSSHALIVNAKVYGGELSVSIAYDEADYAPATMALLTASLQHELQAVIAHCSSGAGGVSPSDFPLARLSRQQLAHLLPASSAAHAIEDIYPATALQNGMLFHSLLQQGQGVYLKQKRFSLRGSVRLDDLAQAWRGVIARHAILRTRFSWEHGGDALQIVEKQVGLPLSLHDWRAKPAAQYQQELAAWCAADLATDFDFGVAPLLRINVFQGADGVQDYVCTHHHAILDGWSDAQLSDEVIRAYEGGAREQAPARSSYRDYIAWLQSKPEPRQWWQQRQARFDQAVGLSGSVLRAGDGSTLAAANLRQHVQTLDADVTQRLDAAAQRHRVTPNTLVQAAWSLVLGRYAGREQVAFGVTLSGRPDELAGADKVLGLFINSLPLWLQLPAAQGVVDYLHAVQDANSDLQEQAATSISQLQQWTGMAGDALFDNLLVFENYQIETTASTSDGGDNVELDDTALAERTHYAMVLVAIPDSCFRFRWKFDASRIDAPVVQRLAGHFVQVLQQLMAAENSLVLGNIQLAAQDHEPVARAQHGFAPIAARISARAALQPAAPALHCEGERLNYGELEAWSNRIAHRLQRLGVRADERVGLCVARSVGMSAGLLGIMKSGGAFVPLDPDYPEDRLAYMLEDAGVRRVLADAATAERLAVLLKDCEVVVISALQDEADTPLVAEVHPQQLAYVIYTSGSTGRPKGVAISQDALSRHLDDFIQTYAISASDKQFQSSTINFDVALHEMLPALIQGGQVEMRGPQLWDLATTSRHLAEQGVTFSRIPTAYWQQWLRNPPAASELAALRQITVGGEGLPGDALRQWREGPLRHIRLDNLYGPTETTVACMYRETTASDTEQAIVSIGQAYASRSVYVLDGEGNEVPVGGLGELCIGGDTLARGYLDRADLTAEKFIPDPYRRDGARLYRSGDLCRRREDGTIDFLGRMDQQVKLRGFRIELGEIEAVLRQVTGVREAVVELKGEGEGKRLVAYTVGAATEAQLRQDSAKKLPGYMVPSVFVELERLPVMQNGKVDRKALPDPEQGADTERLLVAPRNDTERQLLAIWREVLGREDIGVSDNFFEVGGDSLTALKLAHLAAKQGIAGFTLEGIFTHPSIALLASALDGDAKQWPPHLVRLNNSTAALTVFAIHPLYGLVAEYRQLARTLEADAAFIGVQSPHYTDANWWPGSLSEVAQHYADSILAVQPQGPFLLAGWSLGGMLCVEIAHLLEQRGHQVALLATVDSTAPHQALAGDAEESRAMAIRPITEQELDPYRHFLQQSEKFQDDLPQEEHLSLLRKVVLVSKYFESLNQSVRRKTIKAVIKQWWAVPAGEQKSAEIIERWQRYADTQIEEVGEIAALHMDILHEPTFVAQFRQAILLAAKG